MNKTLLSIINGESDSELDAIAEAVRTRKHALASINVVSVSHGDTVRFSDRIRPKYLVGLTAEVVKRNPKSVVVNCPSDLRYGRFSGARNVRCPNDLIERLAA